MKRAERNVTALAATSGLNTAMSTLSSTDDPCRAFVFLEMQPDDEHGISNSEMREVGVFGSPEKAWEAARLKCRELEGIGYTVRGVKPMPDWKGLGELRGHTHPHALKLIDAVQRSTWSLPPDQSEQLDLAMRALHATLITGWTEVDEALVRFSSATRKLMTPTPDIVGALDSIRCGAGMLHRWQDRGGRIGNVA